MKNYPHWVCVDCGTKASGGKQFDCSTWHIGACEVCGKEIFVTEARDFYYPKFKGFKDQTASHGLIDI